MPAPKGTQPPGGSRAGKPNKATKELKDMIAGALSDAGGQSYLKRQATENPSAFLALIGKLLPRDVNANVSGSLDLRGWLQKLGEPDGE